MILQSIIDSGDADDNSRKPLFFVLLHRRIHFQLSGEKDKALLPLSHYTMVIET